MNMSNNKMAVFIGTNLHSKRITLGLTQAQVATAAKTNVNYYAKLERGEAVPSLAMLEKVAKALKVTSSDLLPF